MDYKRRVSVSNIHPSPSSRTEQSWGKLVPRPCTVSTSYAVPNWHPVPPLSSRHASNPHVPVWLSYQCRHSKVVVWLAVTSAIGAVLVRSCRLVVSLTTSTPFRSVFRHRYRSDSGTVPAKLSVILSVNRHY